MARWVCSSCAVLTMLTCVLTGARGVRAESGASTEAGEAAADAPFIERIDALAARELAKKGAVGLSVAVARGDRVILSKGYGTADLENGIAATDASVFRIASVTKQFTAAAVLRMAERGKLRLDDDFTKYIEFPTHGKTVTIRHLLTHTSGLKSYNDVPGFFDDIARDRTPDKVLEPVRGQPLEFEPGTKWSYSNTGYHLLGMIIEKVSGKTYGEHMRDDLFTPLGLSHTRYDIESDIIPGRARGYGLMNGEPANASHLSMTIPYAAGGLVSTAGDLVKWELALNAGKVVSPDSLALMTTPAKLADGSATEYGMGMFMSQVDGHRNVMHSGGMPGFNSMLVHFTEEKLTVAVISNSPAGSAGYLAAEIARVGFGG